jgi:hypothetical protein
MMLNHNSGNQQRQERRVGIRGGGDGCIHYSFLLRLWQVPARGENIVRFLLENIQTGERCGFASLEELSEYLSSVISQDEESINQK